MKKTDLKNLPFNGVSYLVDEFIQKSVSRITNEDIVHALKKSYELKDNYVFTEAFLNGLSTGINRDQLYKDITSQGYDHLKNLKSSIRVTNVQKVIDPIKEITRYLYTKHNLPASCNLYITPNKDSNCFKYHSDYQETIIYQFSGRKEWSFPLEESGDHICIPNFLDASKKFENTKSYIFDKGDILAFPHSIIHKANIVSVDVSIHFTFAIIRMNEMDLLKLILDECLEHSEVKNKLNTPMTSSESYSKAFDNFSEKFKSLDKEKILKSIKEKEQNKEMILLKKGRRY